MFAILIILYRLFIKFFKKRVSLKEIRRKLIKGIVNELKVKEE